MAMLPVRIVPGAHDLTDFTKLVVPSRQLTREERAVYRELAVDWAVIDAKQQLALYVMLQDGRLAEFLDSIFVKTATKVMNPEDGITDSAVKQQAVEFRRALLQEHAGHQMGYYRIMGQQYAQRLTRDITPPPIPRNRWLQLLAGDHE